ncbi:antibiotic biosynthesis monooxygenase [Duganella sp. Leaf126]|uniref:antibiotic biosynthesis monooxygenase family protein n=1 Tax=Duganella sp. Leaf126 TaxID=1736266 RepID=UPI0006F69A41|nr:antibiotic biosynthesis monooxygenase family protein [Duganella sp. Leaf126]KQQ45358.1 antibiotic biosynthesis monooxygenase [Duganella sp. Leaf126]
MIYEVAELYIRPESHTAFQAGVAEAVPLFRGAKGCVSMRLDRDIETPDTYHLVIGWETLENHTVDFRGSEDFHAWRALVGDHFARPPKVEHFATVVDGF